MATESASGDFSTSSTSDMGRAWIVRHPLNAFFVLAFLGTWLIVWPLALTTGEYGLDVIPFEVPEGLDFLLVQFSAYTGPLLAAILVTRVVEGPEGMRKLRRRILQWRVSPVWYLVVIIVPLLLWLSAYSFALDGDPLTRLADDWTLLLSTFLPLVVIGLILPSLGEEPGWRGFALPRLQERSGPLIATLVLGTMHGLWHIPAFFTAALGPVSVITFVTFMLTAVAGTFLYTWVFNNARGSIFLAMLLHASSNAASGIMNDLVPDDVEYSAFIDDGWLNVVAFWTMAIILLIVTRGRLGYRDENL